MGGEGGRGGLIFSSVTGLHRFNVTVKFRTRILVTYFLRFLTRTHASYEHMFDIGRQDPLNVLKLQLIIFPY